MAKMSTTVRLETALYELYKHGGLQTEYHVQNAAILMAAFAKALNYRLGYNIDIFEAFYAGLLHDVGKLFVSASDLASTAGLNKEKYDRIKRHVVAGNGVIQNLDIPENYKKAACEAAGFHHANYKGGGYCISDYNGDVVHPVRSAIPLFGRLCRIADTFEAMTNNRSYQEGRSINETIEAMKGHIIENGAYDPLLFKVFVDYVVPQVSKLPLKKLA